MNIRLGAGGLRPVPDQKEHRESFTHLEHLHGFDHRHAHAVIAGSRAAGCVPGQPRSGSVRRLRSAVWPVAPPGRLLP
jgi:hypothetical protein